MTKKEFRKLLKEAKHPLYKEQKFIIAATILVLLTALVIILAMSAGIIGLEGVLIIIVGCALPMVLDIMRDLAIHRGYREYQQTGFLPETKSKTALWIGAVVIASLTLAGSVLYTVGTIVSDGVSALKEVLEEEEWVIDDGEDEDYEPADGTMTVETESGRAVQTRYETITGEDFSVKIPVDFTVMDADTMSIYYSTEGGPWLVYTNEDNSVDVTVADFGELEDDQVRLTTKMLEKTYEESGELLASNAYESQGHNIGEVAFLADGYYNKMILFAVDGEGKMLTFNCEEDMIEEWGGVGNFILESLYFE